GNNATVTAQPILIDVPPPADLVVDSVIAPGSAQEGQAISITWTVSNHSATQTAVGRWADALYLSADATWDLGDPLIGVAVNYPDDNPIDSALLAPGQSYTRTVTETLPIALPGTYRIIVRPNVFDDIPSKTRNPLASANSFDLTVPIVQL